MLDWQRISVEGWVARVMRLSFRRKRTVASDTLETLLAQAREGNKDAREQLLREYSPFVERVARSTCKRAITRTDDEFQIALVAMNEAIDSYQPGRGSFVGFAETVMRRRLIDSFRGKRLREVPFTAFDEEDGEGNVQNAVETATAVRAYADDEEAAARSQEIALYSQELERFGLTFRELVKLSPKHADARENAIAVARLIATDAQLRQTFLKSRSLPLKQLQSRVGVSRKTLERQRGYIVAVTVLLIGDYELLRAFVQRG